MYLSEMQNKDIVSIKDGKRLGNIIDIEIDDDGNLASLIAKPKFFKNVFSQSNEFEVKWNQIKTIGEDIILVDDSTIF